MTDVITVPGAGSIQFIDNAGAPQSLVLLGITQNELYIRSDSLTTGVSPFAGLATPLVVFQDSATGGVFAPGYNTGANSLTFALGSTSYRWDLFARNADINGTVGIGTLSLTNPLPVASGGTGLATMATTNGVLYASSASAIALSAAPSANGQFFGWNGVSFAWLVPATGGAATSISIGTTAATSGTAGSVLYVASGPVVQQTAIGTSGQFLISGGVAAPTWGVAVTSVSGGAGIVGGPITSTGTLSIDQTGAFNPSWIGAHIFNRPLVSYGPGSSDFAVRISSTSVASANGAVLEIGSGPWSGTGGFTGDSTAGGGTQLGINAVTGFVGNLIDAQKNGVSQFKLSNAGAATFVGAVTASSFSGSGSGLTANTIPTASLVNGATGQIHVANASGVFTTVSMSGDATIAASGAITLATVGVVKGGTGLATLGVANGLLYGSGTAALLQTPTPVLNNFLSWNGSAYVWAAGSSGVTSLTAPGGSAQTGAINFLNGTGITVSSSGQNITITATGGATASGIGIGATAVTGSPVPGAVLFVGPSSTFYLSQTAAGTSGQFLQSAGASTPVWASAVTSVSSGAGIVGGPITSTGTLAIDQTSAFTPSWLGAHIFNKTLTVTTPGTTDYAVRISSASVASANGAVFEIGSGLWSGAGGFTGDSTASGGTQLGINAVTGFVGNLIDAQKNGVSQFKLSNAGAATFVGTVTASSFSGSGSGLTANTIPTASLVNGATGQIHVANASGVFTTVSMSGDATIAASGAITLATVTVPKGGTGQTSFTTGQILYGNASGAVSTISTLAFNSASGALTAGSGILTLGGNLSTTGGNVSVTAGGFALTLAGNLTTVGAFATSITTTGSTSVTLPTAGTLITTSPTATQVISGAKTTFAAAVAGYASINLPTSAAINPTAPISGDIWWNGSNLNFYNGSLTKDLLAASGGTVTSVTASTPISSSGGNTPNLILGTVLVANGGTGQTTFSVANGLIYASGTTAFAQTPAPVLNNFLSWNGSAYVWAAGTGSFTGGTLTSALVLATGTTSAQPLKFQSGANLTTAVAGSMEWDGASLYYTPNSTTPVRLTVAYTTSSISGTASNVTGVVAVANGGTGLTSFANVTGVLYSSSTSALAVVAAPTTSGQYLGWNGTVLSWTTPPTGGAASSVGVGTTTATSGTVGQVLVVASGPVIGQTSSGTAGQFLQYVSTSAVPAWATAVTSVSAGNSTLSVAGTVSAPTLALNLANANTWTATQTFPSVTVTGLTAAGFVKNSAVGVLSTALISATDLASAPATNYVLTYSGSAMTWSPSTFSGGTLTSTLTLSVGTISAPPLKFQSGANLTTAVAGSMEWDGTNLYYTPSGTTRQTVAYLTSSVANVTGIVALANGGTNTSLTATSGGIVYSTASAMAISAAGTSGYLLQSNGAAAPTWVVPSGGTSFTWQAITASATAVVNNGYITNSATVIAVLLPATSVVGALIEVAGQNTGGWQVTQAAGQQIFFGSAVTTVGTGGSLASINQHDCVRIVCITANTTWLVVSSVGNINVT